MFSIILPNPRPQATREGGGLYMASILGRVGFSNAQFVANTAAERGGGLALEAVNAVAAEALRLEGNAATTGMVRAGVVVGGRG